MMSRSKGILILGLVFFLGCRFIRDVIYYPDEADGFTFISWEITGSDTIPPFYMMEGEVTNKQYREFLKEVNTFRFVDSIQLLPDTAILSELWISEYYNYFRNDLFNDYPVLGLNKQQMIAYADWLSKSMSAKFPLASNKHFIFRLPTKNEWQYAALYDSYPNAYYHNGCYTDTNSYGHYLFNSFHFGVKKHLGITDSWTISSANRELVDSTLKSDELLFLQNYKRWRKSARPKTSLRHPIMMPNKSKSGWGTTNGLYNMCGNVAEMTSDGFAMGGSFKLESHYMRIRTDRFSYPFNKDKPQVDLGFRLVYDYIGTVRSKNGVELEFR